MAPGGAHVRRIPVRERISLLYFLLSLLFSPFFTLILFPSRPVSCGEKTLPDSASLSNPRDLFTDAHNKKQNKMLATQHSTLLYCHAHLATLPRALTADWEGSECVDPGGAELMKCVVVFAAMDDASEAAVKYAAAQHTAKAE